MLIDTHAHLGDPVFDPDREDILKKAQAAGVHAVINVSENLAEAERNTRLEDTYPMLLPAAGLAPSFINAEQAELMITFIRGKRSRLWAIGEVGLDYWIVKEEEERGLQREIFGAFIDLALELGLPLNVHSRAAGRHVIDVLLNRGARKVQLHAFDGKASTALPAAEAGFFFSIPPFLQGLSSRKVIVEMEVGSAYSASLNLYCYFIYSWFWVLCID